MTMREVRTLAAVMLLAGGAAGLAAAGSSGVEWLPVEVQNVVSGGDVGWCIASRTDCPDPDLFGTTCAYRATDGLCWVCKIERHQLGVL